MKKLLITATLAMLIAACDAQSTHGPATKKKEQNDVGQPDVHVKVNKKYDEDGNLIGYDSTYTSTYYSYDTGGMPMDMDSLMRGFRSHFDTGFPGMMVQPFDQMFFSDSLLGNDFFRNDYFLRQFEQNQKQLKDMFQRMDSLKNNYFYEFRNEQKEKNEPKIKST